MSARDRQSLDYEQLFMDGRMKKGRSFRTLWHLYQGQRGYLLLSLLFFIVKHSPVWIIPVVTADMINIVSKPGADLTWFWIDLALV